VQAHGEEAEPVVFSQGFQPGDLEVAFETSIVEADGNVMSKKSAKEAEAAVCKAQPPDQSVVGAETLRKRASFELQGWKSTA
jgi:hypothetical protein